MSVLCLNVIGCPSLAPSCLSYSLFSLFVTHPSFWSLFPSVRLCMCLCVCLSVCVSVCLCLSFSALTSVVSSNTTGCSESLGIRSRLVSDRQITASSVFRTWGIEAFSWQPHYARLDKQGKTNAWAAASNNRSEWLQVQSAGGPMHGHILHARRAQLRHISDARPIAGGVQAFWIWVSELVVG